MPELEAAVPEYRQREIACSAQAEEIPGGTSHSNAMPGAAIRPGSPDGPSTSETFDERLRP